MPAPDLLAALTDAARPCFLFGVTPPRDGTSDDEARRIADAFAARSRVLATDGFIVYDLQDEAVRTAAPRPFPFRKTMDAARFAALFFALAGKRALVYKAVGSEDTPAGFDGWLAGAEAQGHTAFTLVGAPSSSAGAGAGLSLLDGCARAAARPGLGFGCVAIAERHTTKGTEHENMARKAAAGARWFITQGIFAAAPVVALLNDYGALCRARGVAPRKVVLTFAPVGRRKTLDFIRWLGMVVPAALEERVFAAAAPVAESLAALREILLDILAGARASGVPLGLNVESVSIVREEIDGAHALFQSLQATLLDFRAAPWAVRWFDVGDALALAEGEAARARRAMLAELRDIVADAVDRRDARAQASLAALAAPAALGLAALLAAFAAGRAAARA